MPTRDLAPGCCDEAERADSRSRIGLVLSAGAYHCAAHIGVIRALEGGGIPIDLVVGTSAGALAGLMYCAEVSAAAMTTSLRGIRLEDFFTPQTAGDGFTDMHPARKGIQLLIGPDRDIQSFSRQFACVAADALTGKPVILSSGNAASAVEASMALPGLIRPVSHAGQLLVDGAVVHPVPVKVARNLGADFVIAVDVNVPRYGSSVARHPAESFAHCFDMAIRRLCDLELMEADVVIQPAVTQLATKFENVGQFVEAGERAGHASLPLIRMRLKAARMHAQSEERKRQ